MLKITRQNKREAVYDITVSDNENFFANGILVHNCAEIDLPTKPLNDLNDPDGEISLCTLSAINWGNIRTLTDFERVCRLAVRGLDALLSYQNYPILAAQLSTEKRRPLGVGIINFAYWMAKNGLSYQNIDAQGLALIDEWAEAWSYYLIKASADLAVEFGACPGTPETKYGLGITPNQTYASALDELVPHQERMDWQGLREQLKTTGIRNSTLMALMPSECQSLANEMRLKDGTVVTLAEVIQDYGKIDINTVHEKFMIGQRFPFLKPVELSDSIAYECYYNGPQSVTEIELEDGSVYKFTNNHKLLVLRNNIKEWIEVKDLLEDDDIVSVNDK
jgi:hypothetical protein